MRNIFIFVFNECDHIIILYYIYNRYSAILEKKFFDIISHNIFNDFYASLNVLKFIYIIYLLHFTITEKTNVLHTHKLCSPYTLTYRTKTYLLCNVCSVRIVFV